MSKKSNVRSVTPVRESESIVRCDFVPKEDITAYELALLLPFLFGRYMFEGDWDRLEKLRITRHLIRQ